MKKSRKPLIKKQNRKTMNKMKKRTKTNKCLRQMKGGLPPRCLRDVEFGQITDQTMGDCINELITASYYIYNNLLRIGVTTTIICGGQSPAYYCLAMMHFKIYNPALVNIVILPHSKGGTKSADQKSENIAYCNQLKKKGINLRTNVVIIDGVHSGTGILALESALQHCWNYKLIIKKIAINAFSGLKIKVDEEIVLRCEPKFSDTFPRIVTHYFPRNFDNESMFVTEFIGLSNNPIAEMIIDIAREYPAIRVEDTAWFDLNNEVTEEIAQYRAVFERLRDRELRTKAVFEQQIRDRELRTKQSYETIILYNPKRYQCPACGSISGTSLIATHMANCEHRLKAPIEPTIEPN